MELTQYEREVMKIVRSQLREVSERDIGDEMAGVQLSINTPDGRVPLTRFDGAIHCFDADVPPKERVQLPIGRVLRDLEKKGLVKMTAQSEFAGQSMWVCTEEGRIVV